MFKMFQTSDHQNHGHRRLHNNNVLLAHYNYKLFKFNKYLLSIVLISCFLITDCISQSQQPLFSGQWHGGYLADRRVLLWQQSPYTINEEIVVGQHGRLLIEPGVQLQFRPRTGITVKGTLIAKVTIS